MSLMNTAKTNKTAAAAIKVAVRAGDLMAKTAPHLRMELTVRRTEARL